MKAAFILALLVQFQANMQAPKIPYEITVKLTHPPAAAKYIILQNFTGKLETVPFNNGTHTFKGSVDNKGNLLTNVRILLADKPYKTIVEVFQSKPDYRDITLDGERMTITGRDKLKEATVTGGKLTEDLNILYRYDREEEAGNIDYNKEHNKKIAAAKGDAAMIKQLNEERLKKTLFFQDEKKLKKIGFIKDNPSSYASLRALTEVMYLSADNINLVEELYNNLAGDLKQCNEGSAISNHIKKQKTLAANKLGVGNKAPAFTLPDINNKSISLSDYKGQYVLVDFWASWCQPCRKENPHLRKAWLAYKDKGLNILGISLDNNRTNWLAAVKEDQLSWPQLSDLKASDSKVKIDYGIRSIPSNFLVDPDGKIVAMNLRGDSLMIKLSAIISK